MEKVPFFGNPSFIKSALLLFSLFVCLGSVVQAREQSRNVLCRPELSISHRNLLASKLRAITGWTKLDFDSDGALYLGSGNQAVGGSNSARELLMLALTGQTVVIFEDASDRPDVVFARVVDGRWTRDAASKPHVNLVLIDFADFNHVIGDDAALAAFNEGWAVLHEISHVVNGSGDAEKGEDLGECEALINKMRRECGLAERAEYFFNYFPGQQNSTFPTRFVRLAFDLQTPTKKKRSWIMWDGAVVGGLDASKQVAIR